MLVRCLFLFFPEFPDAARHHPHAERQHDREHDAIEGLMLEHLWIGRQESVVAEPEQEGHKQDRKEEGMVERIRRRASSLGCRGLSLLRRASRLGPRRIRATILLGFSLFSHVESIAWLPSLGSMVRSSKLV
jgi:hypothetical protein